MHPTATILGTVLILLVLWEGFESIILPRRVTRRFRLTRFFYRTAWVLWVSLVGTLVPKRLRETVLSFFGPLSILVLLSIWAMMLITGFALMQWGNGSALKMPAGPPSLLSDLYFSGTTFFTLGLGDITPVNPFAQYLTVIEGGMGFAFLALVISYLPPLNQSFARREVSISLLDARAGSPPTAAEILIRHSHDRSLDSLRQLLYEWERWSAELMEGHLSYPVLAYFRSQHDNQSWLGALTAILDTCALVMVGLRGSAGRQAELTFAMARHAVVDLALVFSRAPREPEQDRLPPQLMDDMRKVLSEAGLILDVGGDAEEKLLDLRLMYEPFVDALANYFHLAVPPWFIPGGKRDNWQVTAWEKRVKPGKRESPGERIESGHF